MGRSGGGEGGRWEGECGKVGRWGGGEEGSGGGEVGSLPNNMYLPNSF